MAIASFLFPDFMLACASFSLVCDRRHPFTRTRILAGFRQTEAFVGLSEEGKFAGHGPSDLCRS